MEKRILKLRIYYDLTFSIKSNIEYCLKNNVLSFKDKKGNNVIMDLNKCIYQEYDKIDKKINIFNDEVKNAIIVIIENKINEFISEKI